MLNTIIADRDFQKLHRLLSRESIFSIMNIEDRELQHTALLSWLLNPLAGHGMGAIPLRTFFFLAASAMMSQKSKLEAFHGVEFIDAVALSSFDVDKLQVTPEYNIRVGPEQKQARLDVLIYQTAGSTITPYLVIEYKVNAQEGPNQTPKYAAWVKDAERPTLPDRRQLHPLMVYLCKENNQDSPAQPFVKVFYKEFKDWVDALKRLPTKTEQGKVLVEEFSILLETYSTGSEESEGLLERLKKRFESETADILALDEDEKSDDPILERAWEEYERAFKQIGLERAGRPSMEVVAWDRIVRATLSEDRWAISGRRCLMIHNLGFRNWVTQFAGRPTNNPRLQLYVGANGDMDLRFYWNKKATELLRQKMPTLVGSLRRALEHAGNLSGAFVMHEFAKGPSVAKILVHPKREILDGVQQIGIADQFKLIIATVEQQLDIWLQTLDQNTDRER